MHQGRRECRSMKEVKKERNGRIKQEGVKKDTIRKSACTSELCSGMK
jgi:hypothetical protein